MWPQVLPGINMRREVGTGARAVAGAGTGVVGGAGCGAGVGDGAGAGAGAVVGAGTGAKRVLEREWEQASNKREVKLLSSDGVEFITDMETAKCLGTVKTLLEDCGLEERTETIDVPLPEICAETLRLVLQWVKHHKEIPKSDDSSWEKKFLNVEQRILITLMNAADYLDIQDLLEVASKAVAGLMEEKTTEEMREIFKVKNDFSLSEQEKLRRENMWHHTSPKKRARKAKH